MTRSIRSVFISSTVEDLHPERDEIARQLHRLGYDPIRINEDAYTGVGDSFGFCLEKVRACDALILMIAGKYGCDFPGTDGSVTETELTAFTDPSWIEGAPPAVGAPILTAASGLPVPLFCFIKTDDSGKWICREKDPTRQAKLKAFKERVDKQLFRTTFKNLDQLGREVVLSICCYEKKFGGIGVNFAAFETFDEFFRRDLDKSSPICHAYPLVGRSGVLARMRGFCEDFEESGEKFMILSGRGGLGKSKLLYESLSPFKDVVEGQPQVRFVSRDVDVKPRDAGMLPAGRIVLVVDDIQEREDAAIIISIAQQRPDRIKLVLSTRPWGLSAIKGLLKNVKPIEVLELQELQELTGAENKQLGEEVLDQPYKHLAKNLAGAFGDCPLVLVYAARLLNMRQIDPALLSQQQEFRDKVLARFEDESVATAVGDPDQKSGRNILRLVAALHPVTAEQITGSPMYQQFVPEAHLPSTIAIGLGELEKAGEIIRRKRGFQVHPNTRSDYILEKNCISQSGEPTRYAYEVFRAFERTAGQNVLLNLAALDWQLRRAGRACCITDSIWTDIENRFTSGGAGDRSATLEMVCRIAWLQPEQSLRLVELALREGPGWTSAMTSIAKNVAYHPDHVSRCADLLWEAGKDDPAALHSHPQHPIRVLGEASGFDPHDPPRWRAVAERVLNRIKVWLDEKGVWEHAYSPLDVLDAIMERMAERVEQETPSKGLFVKYWVLVEHTGNVRPGALSILENSLASGVPAKGRRRAFESLKRLVDAPHGIKGGDRERRIIESWSPERLQASDIVSEWISKGESNLALRNEVRRDMIRRARHNDPPFSTRAQELLNSIRETLELMIVDALRGDFWDVLGRGGDWKATWHRKLDEQKELAHSFAARYPDPEAGFQLLESSLCQFNKAGIQPGHSDFLSLCSQLAPETTLGIIERILSDPGCNLAAHFGLLLDGLWLSDRPAARNTMLNAIKVGSEQILGSIASRFGAWGRDATSEDIPILGNLVRSQFKNVQIAAINAIGWLPESLFEDALAVVVPVPLEQNDATCRALCKAGAFMLHDATEAARSNIINALLPKLVSAKDLSDAGLFLETCIRLEPTLSIEALIKFVWRIDRYSFFLELPYQWRHDSPFDKLAGTPGYSESLRKLLGAISSCTDERVIRNLSELSARLFQKLPDDAVGVLRESVQTGDRNRVRGVGRFLARNSADISIKRPDFITELLQRAVDIDASLADEIESLLLTAPYGTFSSGPPGPAQYEINARDTALKIADGEAKGTPAERYYRHFHEQMKRKIERETDMLRDMSDDGE